METIHVNHTCALVRPLELQYGSRTLGGKNADSLVSIESDGPSNYNRRSSYYGGRFSVFLHTSIWGMFINFPGASFVVSDLGNLGIPVCYSGSTGGNCRASGRIMGFFRGAMAKSKNSWKWFALVLRHSSNNIPPIYFEDCGDL
jgi:hypothetical protein